MKASKKTINIFKTAPLSQILKGKWWTEPLNFEWENRWPFPINVTIKCYNLKILPCWKKLHLLTIMTTPNIYIFHKPMTSTCLTNNVLDLRFHHWLQDNQISNLRTNNTVITYTKTSIRTQVGVKTVSIWASFSSTVRVSKCLKPKNLSKVWM